MVDINQWTQSIIEGPGGMDAFENREVVEFGAPDRVAAARWAIRCLANPRCEGSADVLAAILARRMEVADTMQLLGYARRRPEEGESEAAASDP